MDIGSNPLVMWLDSLIEKMIKNKIKVLIAFLGLIGLIGLFFGYRFYQHKVQVEAHQDFMEALSAYDVPLQGYRDRATPLALYFNTEEDKWKKVLELFERGSKKHAHSGLGPMFRLFHAEALLHVNRYSDALAIMKETVETVKSQELREMYRVKLSLMQLDNKQQNEVTEGLERLKGIAFNQQSVAHSQALYHLGYYFWVHKKFDDAKNYWQQFLVRYGDQAGFAEQIKVVKGKLELIAV